MSLWDRSSHSCFSSYRAEGETNFPSSHAESALIIYSEARRFLTGWPTQSLSYFTAWQPNMRQLFSPQPLTIPHDLSLFLSLDLWGKASNKKHGWVLRSFQVSACRCCLDRCSFTSALERENLPSWDRATLLWHHHLKWWIFKWRVKSRRTDAVRLSCNEKQRSSAASWYWVNIFSVVKKERSNLPKHQSDK